MRRSLGESISDWQFTEAPEPASDVWPVTPALRSHHIASIATDSRSLLGALLANVQFVRASLDNKTLEGGLVESLHDIEACCERLSSLIDDAVVGVRDEGLQVTRNPVPFGSLIWSAVRRVYRRVVAQRAQITLENDTTAEVVAMLDGLLFSRALDKLLDFVIQEASPGEHLVVRYWAQPGKLLLEVTSVGEMPTNVRVSGPPQGPVSDEHESSSLSFARGVVRAHGGRLEIVRRNGFAPSVRIHLPWQAP